MAKDERSYEDDEDAEGLEQLIARLRGHPPPHVYDPPGKPIARVSRAIDGSGWGECDPSVLDDSRAPVPAFPLEVLPGAWRDWVQETARAAAAPVDYVALSLVCAVSGLCGAAVRVQAAPGWLEPVVLWQALIGAPSSGKSPAIEPLRTLLSRLTQQSAGGDGSPSEHPLQGFADAAAADARSALLWCDEPAEWVSRIAASSAPARTALLRAWSGSGATPAFALLACLQPEMVPLIAKNGVELAARFLFTWPHQPPYQPLAGRKSADDEGALAALRRLRDLPGAADAPTILSLEEQALPALDSFLAKLHLDVGDAEGLEQAWQGKGRGTVLRLIGCLALLDWSLGGAETPGPVGASIVERAIALWANYLRPHARAVLELAAPDDLDRKARQVVRWLRLRGGPHVSREEVRCDALGRSVNAATIDRILHRLQSAGVVKQLLFAMPPQGGRPPNRWEVNPRLRAAGNAGNSGNLPESA